MKLPSIFVPEKNLDNKIYELIKEPENDFFGNVTKYHYSELDFRVIYKKAKEVAEKLGKLDSVSSAYTFEDKETRMIIEYFPWYQDQTTHLRIYSWMETTYNQPGNLFIMVFKADKGSKLSAYHIKDILHIPGEWETDLEKLYKKT